MVFGSITVLWFRQVLYNLLSNAIKFTPEGGSIAVEAAVADGEVRVSVRDTGVGIAPADQELIFEEFGQVGDASARREGTGLGLALTRRLVEAHGGRIELHSLPGEGSTFTVVLPSPTPARAVAEEQPDAVDADGRPRAGATVLIIEDDPSAVRFLRACLEGDGHRVLVAGDGVAGLALAREEPPAAILLDIPLPGMDGWEVLRALKADPELRNIPVIVETIVDERGLGLALGAVDYFLKPIDRQALLDRLAGYSFTSQVGEQPGRVLAVDDEPSAMTLVEAALRPEGFVITGAAGGNEAVELASRTSFDLVICDLLMPDLDGFGVVSKLRSNPATHDLPILILTGHELSEADKKRLNGEILGVVEKGDDAVQGLRQWLARVPSNSGRREVATGARP
jgi:CheY-like chemotaxis protein